MNWLDYVIIAMLGIGFISGIRKGLLKSISNIACIIASIYIAKGNYRKVSEFLIRNTSIQDMISKFIEEKNIANSLLQPPKGDSAVFSFSQSFASELNGFISVLIINAISVLIVYLVVRGILALAETYLAGVLRLPGLNELNRLAGGLVGLAQSVIVLMLIFSIITPTSSFKFFSSLSSAIENSVMAKFFYSYNFILGWIWTAASEIIKK